MLLVDNAKPLLLGCLGRGEVAERSKAPGATLACPVGNHEERGMLGTVTVRES